VPDYPPPFVPRATRVDLEGRIWLLERANIGSKAPLVYDVIDRSGQIVDRVRMPANAAVLGFGPNGSVYLSITPQNLSLAASMVQQVNANAPPGAMTAPVKVARAVLPKKQGRGTRDWGPGKRESLVPFIHRYRRFLPASPQ
jgi:hypothetical protein